MQAPELALWSLPGRRGADAGGFGDEGEGVVAGGGDDLGPHILLAHDDGTGLARQPWLAEPFGESVVEAA